MLEYFRKRLGALLEERAALAAKRDAVLEAPSAEQRDLTEEEAAAFEQLRAAVAAKDEEIEQVRGRIDDLMEDERRQANVDALTTQYTVDEQRGAHHSPARVVSEPATYRRGGRNSYFRDLVSAQLFGSREAADRLIRNDMEMRALSTTDGAIGEFVPPLWMVEEFVRLARAGRVIADQLRSMPLPAGTDSISVPRLLTGTETAEQTTENTAVQDTDATSDSVTARVATIAGKQVVSLQLIEQSPINIDDVLLADLAADYATKLDRFVISNNATGKRGLLNVSGVNTVTFTSPVTVAGLYPKVADAIQQVSTKRFLPPQKIFMHPRRWAWFTAALDTAERPLVVPAARMPMDALATMGDVVAEGFVGVLQGLPVYQDPNIPTNLGTGTNEDRVIIARTDDIILMEGASRAEVFRETKADTLSVLLRFYNYVALHSERYPKSISVIAGAGLVPPTF